MTTQGRICILASALSILPAGCVAPSTLVQGPNGPAYVIKCGAARVERCYEEASKVCSSGWRIADKQDSGVGAAVPTFGGATMLVRGPNTMLIECKS